MSVIEGLHLTRLEALIAIVLPLLGSTTIVSIVLCIRTAPGLFTWSVGLLNVIFYISLEVYLIKVLRTPGAERHAISTHAAIDLIAASACSVALGICAIVAVIWAFNGNERTINDAITTLIGNVLIWICFGLTMMHRSRVKRLPDAE
jgi:hypothetical protein